MRDEDTPAKERFTMYMDLGYQGIQKYFPGVNVVLPHKKPRKKKTDSAAPKLTKRAKGIQQKGGWHQGNSREQHRQDKAVFQND